MGQVECLSEGELVGWLHAFADNAVQGICSGCTDLGDRMMQDVEKQGHGLVGNDKVDVDPRDVIFDDFGGGGGEVDSVCEIHAADAGC